MLMYVHGGGFVLGSPAAVTTPVARAARVAHARAFLPRYRLAPEQPYPAMVKDVVTDGGRPLPAAAVIRDDAIALAEKATAAGVDVTLEIWPNMVHLWHNFSYLPDAQRAPERIGQFVDECASAPHT